MRENYRRALKEDLLKNQTERLDSSLSEVVQCQCTDFPINCKRTISTERMKRSTLSLRQQRMIVNQSIMRRLTDVERLAR